MPAPERTCQPRFGPVTIRRLRGWCRRCRAWRFPADPALGLSDPGRASPSVQEASAVSERLTGGKLPPATLERATRRQGQRAEQKRTQQDEQRPTAQGAGQRLPRPEEPFTLVIELDAGNIRARRLGPGAPSAAPPARNRAAGAGFMAAPASGWSNAGSSDRASSGVRRGTKRS